LSKLAFTIFFGVDVSKLPNGTYFIAIENEQTSKKFKFIILKQ
jgi:hypothetical protein